MHYDGDRTSNRLATIYLQPSMAKMYKGRSGHGLALHWMEERVVMSPTSTPNKVGVNTAAIASSYSSWHQKETGTSCNETNAQTGNYNTKGKIAPQEN